MPVNSVNACPNAAPAHCDLRLYRCSEELLEGCRNRHETEQLLRFLAPHRIGWPAPRDFDRVLADLAFGRTAPKIGLTDALIGETAVGLDVPLHTFNVRHFRAIPGLFTAQPYLRRRNPGGHPGRP